MRGNRNVSRHKCETKNEIPKILIFLKDFMVEIGKEFRHFDECISLMKMFTKINTFLWCLKFIVSTYKQKYIPEWIYKFNTDLSWSKLDSLSLLLKQIQIIIVTRRITSMDGWNLLEFQEDRKVVLTVTGNNPDRWTHHSSLSQAFVRYWRFARNWNKDNFETITKFFF